MLQSDAAVRREGVCCFKETKMCIRRRHFILFATQNSLSAQLRGGQEYHVLLPQLMFNLMQPLDFK